MTTPPKMCFILPLLLIFSRKWRVKQAFRWGKNEHRFGRVMVLPMLFGLMWNYFIIYNLINSIIFAVIISFWLVYLISHTLEKRFFGSNGPRG